MRSKGYFLISLVLMVILSGCGSDFEWFPGTVTALSIATSSPLPAGTQGTAYSHPIFASGGKSPYIWTVSSGSPPTGLTLNLFGLLSGTPTATGSFTFTVKVTDSATPPNTATMDFTIQINGGPLTITTAALPAAPTDIPYSQPIVTGGTPPYTFTNLSTATGRKLPHGLVLSTTDGILSGTPIAMNGTTSGSGTFAFTLLVTDSSTQSASQPISIFVPTTGRMFDPTNKVYAEGITATVNGGNTIVTITTVANSDTVDHAVTIIVANYNDTGTEIPTTISALGNKTIVPAGSTSSIPFTATDFITYSFNNWRIKQVTMQ